ncbi:MAG TPA: Trm112 family protein [Thermoanaerobaculia bacterium]|nr:Trm112 family protein [Thermoanaerobaculia bacterium]
MAVDADLLEILACPVDKQPVQVIALSETRRSEIREKYREKFRDEEPLVEEGLRCEKCGRIYPIVSDIPVMLIEEAIEEP